MNAQPHSLELPPPVAGLIAVVGCDGTGKSTLTRELVAKLGRERKVVWRYLGLVSGETGDKIKQLPLIGPRLERRLAAKAASAQDMQNKLTGVWAALIMYGFSLWRRRQLRKVRELAARGVLVITDRYPQAEITGFRCDGPGLGAERSNSALVRRLAAREQQLYREMARYRPALVIRLDIDVDTAHARKPDHDKAELRDKIAVMSKLRFNGAPLVDLDARAPYAVVLEQALQAVARATALPRPGDEEKVWPDNSLDAVATRSAGSGFEAP